MSTFVQLAQELRRLAGVSGTGPTDVATAVSIELNIVNYIKNAWIDIQTSPKKWRWMQRDYLPVGGLPLQTIATTPDYVLSGVQTGARGIRIQTFRSYLTATGVSDRQPLNFVPWPQFRSTYEVATQPDDNRPLVITRLPTGDLRLWPAPDDIYSIEFEYFKTPQILAVNSDVPEMPSEFHQLIVYEALKRYGHAEDAPELIKLGESAGGSDGNEGRPVSGLWRSLIWDQEVRDVENQSDREFMEVRAQ